MDTRREIAALERRLAELDDERRALASRLSRLRDADPIEAGPMPGQTAAARRAPGLDEDAKIALFRSLFRGREDVFARRWENARTGKAGYAPACANEWRSGVCEKPRVTCGQCRAQAFRPVTDDVVRGHLTGRDPFDPSRPFVAGVYPLLPDDTCWFLAVDFDGEAWRRDALAFLAACRRRDVPALLESIGVRFLGILTRDQQKAARALAAHDFGVLAATTAFGKTVVAASLVAERDATTLILVHRRQLAEQWLARLNAFLDVAPGCVGLIGGGRKRPTGIIDVALIQSLVRKGEVADLVAGYGHLVVDECHHLSAVSFEAVARAARARYVLGLSATVTRKDGHHPIVLMQCGPIRHRVDARAQAALRPFAHRVLRRPTRFRAVRSEPGGEPSLADIFRQLARDEDRNRGIVDDVLHAPRDGRSPLVITERKEHLDLVAQRLGERGVTVVAMAGGMGAKMRAGTEVMLAQTRDAERVIVATGRYLGEGFDEPRLDTLFLTMPISWRGVLAQYVGRLHRDYPGKRTVLVHDYVDELEPLLARMARKRESGYRALGYEIVREDDLFAR